MTALSKLIFCSLCILVCFRLYGHNSYNGEDVTRPINRFDVRAKVQTGATSSKGDAYITTLRSDLDILLLNDWQLGLRVDLPFESFHCTHHCHSSCYNSNHMGDSLFQFFLITPTFGKWTFAAGAKFIFPTAGDNLEIGNGKYQALPSVAFKYDLSDWMEQSYWGVIFRHDFSYAGYSNASQIIETYIQPFINIDLPDNWFLNSSPEMFYDWKKREWFIPFDLMVGKMIGKNIVISLEYKSAIVEEYPSFSQELEFRIGFFF